jgi:hypothetical protein
MEINCRQVPSSSQQADSWTLSALADAEQEVSPSAVLAEPGVAVQAAVSVEREAGARAVVLVAPAAVARVVVLAAPEAVAQVAVSVVPAAVVQAVAVAAPVVVSVVLPVVVVAPAAVGLVVCVALLPPAVPRVAVASVDPAATVVAVEPHAASSSAAVAPVFVVRPFVFAAVFPRSFAADVADPVASFELEQPDSEQHVYCWDSVVAIDATRSMIVYPRLQPCC